MLLIKHQKKHPNQKAWVMAHTYFPLETPEHNCNWRSEVNELVREYARHAPAEFVWLTGQYAGQVVFSGVYTD